MITVWPHISCSFWPRRRAMISVAPPGGNGTTRRTGFVGNACASATPGSATANASASARTSVLILSSWVFRSAGAGDLHLAEPHVGHTPCRAGVVFIELFEVERAAP